MKVVRAPADIIEAHYMKFYEVPGETGKWINAAYELEYPEYFGKPNWQKKSMTDKFTHDDFEYVRQVGWGILEKYDSEKFRIHHLERKRHEPFEVRKGLCNI